MLAVIALTGWATGLEWLESFAPGLPTMKPNTAICMGLVAAAVCISARFDPPPAWYPTFPVLAGVIALLTSAQWLFSIELGLDELLFSGAAGGHPASAMRMQLATAIGVASLAIASLRSGFLAPPAFVRQAAALIPLAIGVLALVGHAFDVSELPLANYPFGAVSLPAASSLVLLGLGVLAAEPRVGIARILLDARAGGRFARQVLPIAILFPILVGWLRFAGERSGHFDSRFGVLIMVLSALALFSLIAILTARWLNKSEGELLEAQRLLERRVQDRTTELEATVLKLRAEMALREAAESAGAESRALFQNALEYAPIGMAVVGLDGRWLRVNRALCRIVDYTERELLELTFQDITHPDDLDADLSHVQRLLDGTAPSYQIEKRYLRRNGEIVWVMLHGSMIRDAEGKPLYFIAQIDDITQRRTVLQELEASRKLMNEVVAALPVPFALKDQQKRWVIVNEAMARYSGRSAEELTGRSDAELFGPDVAENYAEEDELALESNEPIGIEGINISASGVRRWVLKHKRGIHLPDGSRMIAVTVTDISGQKEIAERLRKSEERFRSLTQLSADWFWEQDVRYRFTDLSGNVVDATGLEAAEFIGRTRWELPYDNMSADDWAAHRRVLDARQPYRDLMLTRTDARGERHYVAVSGEPTFDEAGQFIGYRGIGRDITAQRRAEIELANNRHFLDAVIEAIPQPVFLKDSSRRWVLFNSAFCEMLERDRDDLLGRGDPDVFDVAIAEENRRDDDEVLSGAGSIVRESARRRADGTTRWQLTTKRRVNLPDGSVGIVGVAADVTSLKQTQEALRASEALHRLLSDNSIDMISLLTPEGVIDFASPASSALIGYAPPEIAGESLLEFVHPEDVPRMREIFAGIQEHSSSVLTCRLRRSAGGWKWIETSFRGARRAGADQSLQIIAVSRDVDDRVRVGEALNRFKYVLDHTLDMIFIYDVETLHFNYVNDGAVKTLGYPKEKLLGMAPWELRGDISVTDYYKSIEPFLRGDIQSRQVETVHRHADGHLIPVDVTMQLVRRPGEAGTFISVARDATERKKVERMKNEFVSTVSHELRTPVTSIRGSLGLVLGGVTGELTPETRQLIEVANSNSERLIRLINDILDIEKIESGKMRFNLRPTPLRGLMASVLDENRGYGEPFGVRFVVRGDLPDISLRVDADRIMQVMANLLSNAAKFSPRGADVEISAIASGASVRIEVTDHGSGIPPEFHARIFGKFSQADASDSRRLGGTGLGLSIAKAIVEKHGGTIGFTTGANGTTFAFELPLAFSTSAPGDGASFLALH